MPKEYATFLIQQPRYHDQVVLLADYKLHKHNKVIFTDDKRLKDHYYVSGETAKQYPLSYNGVIECRAVPLERLQIVETPEEVAKKAKDLFKK